MAAKAIEESASIQASPLCCQKRRDYHVALLLAMTIFYEIATLPLVARNDKRKILNDPNNSK